MLWTENIDMPWIIDPRVGLVSAVVGDDPKTGKPSSTTIMLRARRRQHLENLRRLSPALAGTRITKANKDLDYPARIVVDREVFVQVMAELARSLNYRNVKGEAARNVADLGSDFVAAMHTVHATLARIKDAPSGPDLPKTP